jgi:hypothetical protein
MCQRDVQLIAGRSRDQMPRKCDLDAVLKEVTVIAFCHNTLSQGRCLFSRQLLSDPH